VFKEENKEKDVGLVRVEQFVSGASKTNESGYGEV